MASEEPNLDLVIEGVAAVAELLSAHAEQADPGEADDRWEAFEAKLRADSSTPLAQLVHRFELDSFELKCVILGLANHIEPRMTSLVARTGREMFSRSVTVRLAIEYFCRTPAERVRARQSFLPSSRLVRNRLIALGRVEVGASDGLLSRRFELTTPALRFLLSEDELSESVARIGRLEHPEVSLFNVILDREHLEQVRELVEQHGNYRRLISEWGFDRVLPYGRGLTLLFSGPSGTGKTLLARSLAAHARRSLISLSAADLPEGEGIEAALRDLFSEAMMRDAVVLMDECDALLGKTDRRKPTAFKAIEDFEGILVLTTNQPDALDDALERRIIYHLPFEVPGPALRREIWEVHLPPEVPLDGSIDLDGLAATYDFAGGTIKNAILVAVNRALARNPQQPVLTQGLLEEGCRTQLGYALEDLTVRTTTHLRLNDIVLPEEADRKVREIIAALGNQSVVLNRWGFGRRLVTGKGITVLLDGPPGTGKTFCAEIIAGEFNRPIYRINLPEVVSKWVGETEKHIRAIFQQARVSHAMLLFDEADALFSARVSETESATDRYANMEVNLLLQEIERHPGVVILTTNFYGGLDRALIRRIQYRVTLEEPDPEQRARIWETICPAEAPLAKDVDFEDLSRRFELTGGMIKNALLRAAYRSCERGNEITQEQLVNACVDEYRAAGKLTRDPDYVPETPPRYRNREQLVEGEEDGADEPKPVRDGRDRPSSGAAGGPSG